MWRFIIGLGALSAMTAPAAAAEWWWVSTGGQKPDRRLNFIDKSGFVTDYSGRISAWDFQVYEALQKDGTRKEKALYKFDCKDRTMTLVQLIKFGNNERLIDSFAVKSYQQEPMNIVPDSIGESKWEFVCLGKSEVSEPLRGTPEEFSAFFFKMAK